MDNMIEMSPECQRGFDYVVFNTDVLFANPLFSRKEQEAEAESFIITLLKDNIDNTKMSAEFRQGVGLCIKYLHWQQHLQDSRSRAAQFVIPIQRYLNVVASQRLEDKKLESNFYCEHQNMSFSFACYHLFSNPIQEGEIEAHEDMHFRFNKLESVLRNDDDHSKALTKLQYHELQKQQYNHLQKLKKDFLTLKHAKNEETKQRILRELNDFSQRQRRSQKSATELSGGSVVSRGWFSSPKMWCKNKQSVNLPLDIEKFGNMVNKDGTGFWRSVFKKGEFLDIIAQYGDYIYDNNSSITATKKTMSTTMTTMTTTLATTHTTRVTNFTQKNQQKQSNDENGEDGILMSEIPNEIDQMCSECGEKFNFVSVRNKKTKIFEYVFQNIVKKIDEKNNMVVFVHKTCLNIIRVACQYECHLCYKCGEKIDIINLSKFGTSYDDDFALKDAVNLFVNNEKQTVFHKECACVFLRENMKKTLRTIDNLNEKKKKRKKNCHEVEISCLKKLEKKPKTLIRGNLTTKKREKEITLIKLQSQPQS